MYTLRFDGLFMELSGRASRRSPAGIMSYGWLIFRGDQVVAQGHGAYARGRDASSNVAEYLALIEGLDALSDLEVGGELIKVFGDAKTVIDQMRGHAAVNSESMWPFYVRAKKLANRFLNLRWIWTPRKNNKAADRLTRRAVQQIQTDRDSLDAFLGTTTARKASLKQNRKLHLLMDLRVYQPSNRRGLGVRPQPAPL
ncbi:MAG: ribonuclease HI family protein [Anaerolineales bacterium]|nr:MAG: ribonuclease HI family protein [Anaerolineales bacterium]